MSGKLTVNCVAWKPFHRNTLRGFAVCRIEELKLVVSEIAVHESNGRQWASLPARPWVQNGAVVKGDDGKIKYQPLLEWDGKSVRDAFSAAVIAAILKFDADAFAETVS